MTIIGNMTTESLLIALSGIVIVFLMLAVLSGIIIIISKVVGSVAGVVKVVPAAPPAQVAAPAQPHPAAASRVASTAQSAPFGGAVALSGVDDLTAACIMAIVSDETGVPVNELVFKSIKAI